ncbi:hypothetical protein BDN70DRAFT_938367 [Pholiota conissans]|uniref:Nucleosome assembly protein n=1 Tax=Pholiota conissans TaxID=109636 RepID=A0A9P6CME1_9AGAR|nr:hypothetical protein BDN70DRAFT_938367 [Pholiota conissans]
MADKTPLPFPETVLTDADRKKMDDIHKSVQRAQLIGEFSEMKRMEPIYESRRRFTTTIPKFWPSAFLRHEGLAMDLNNAEDIKALLNLTDVAIQRNPLEPRVFTIEFTFSKNPYFDDRVLKKVYQFTESEARKKEPADREGFKWTMLDFDWDRDVKGSSQKIRWKPGMNLCTKYPKKLEANQADVAELGSFFNWFESDGDVFDIGMIIEEEIFPNAINYFNGEVEDEEDEEEEEDESSDESDDGKHKPSKPSSSSKSSRNNYADDDSSEDDGPSFNFGRNAYNKGGR